MALKLPSIIRAARDRRLQDPTDIDGRCYDEGAGSSWMWLLFRPVFGVAIAFALFLLYKAGQIALGGGYGEALSSDVNLPVLSTLSLIAGLLSWQVLDMIRTRSKRFIKRALREPLWATGLTRAMNEKGFTDEMLAVAVRVSQEQIGRWQELLDPVSPELQDRLVAHLGVEPEELFSESEPSVRRKLRLAHDLAGKIAKANRDVDELARSLNVPTKLVERWISKGSWCPRSSRWGWSGCSIRRSRSCFRTIRLSRRSSKGRLKRAGTIRRHRGVTNASAAS